VQLPAEIFPGLLELPLGGSIYDLLDTHYGITPDEVVEHLEVAEASPDEAALLGVHVRAPLLAITRTSATSAGVPFEFSHDLFRADRTCVTFRTRADRAEIVRRGADSAAMTS
jgi:GntR family transcriptional regulator